MFFHNKKRTVTVNKNRYKKTPNHLYHSVRKNTIDRTDTKDNRRMRKPIVRLHTVSGPVSYVKIVFPFLRNETDTHLSYKIIHMFGDRHEYNNHCQDPYSISVEQIIDATIQYEHGETQEQDKTQENKMVDVFLERGHKHIHIDSLQDTLQFPHVDYMDNVWNHFRKKGCLFYPHTATTCSTHYPNARFHNIDLRQLLWNRFKFSLLDTEVMRIEKSVLEYNTILLLQILTLELQAVDLPVQPFDKLDTIRREILFTMEIIEARHQRLQRLKFDTVLFPYEQYDGFILDMYYNQMTRERDRQGISLPEYLLQKGISKITNPQIHAFFTRKVTQFFTEQVPRERLRMIQADQWLQRFMDLYGVIRMWKNVASASSYDNIIMYVGADHIIEEEIPLFTELYAYMKPIYEEKGFVVPDKIISSLFTTEGKDDTDIQCIYVPLVYEKGVYRLPFSRTLPDMSQLRGREPAVRDITDADRIADTMIEKSTIQK